MSNRVVPAVYASIIADVVSSVRDRFEEEGLDEDGAQTLQELWETNLRMTRVAAFHGVEGVEEGGTDGAGGPQQPVPQGVHMQPNGVMGYAAPVQQRAAVYGVDQHGNGSYSGGLRGGASGALRLRGGAGGSSTGEDEEFDEEEEDTKPFIPELHADVKRESADHKPDVKPDLDNKNDVKPFVSQYHYPGSDSKGAIKRDPAIQPNASGIYPGEEIIDSDLDDSDDEDEDGLGGEDEDEEEQDEFDRDVMFCVYDKVARVKNKWKVNFKDGFIRANGREYLFSRCNGEFEW